MTQTLLTIDAASVLGWAFGPTDAVTPESGFLALGKPGSSPAQRFCAAIDWTWKVIKEKKPDHIIMESAIYLGDNTTFKTQQLLLGVQGCILGTAQKAGHFRTRTESAATARSFFLPHPPKVKGQPTVKLDTEQKKLLVRRRCLEFGWITEDDTNLDQTDALCMWAYGVSLIDQPNSIRFSPLFSGQH